MLDGRKVIYQGIDLSSGEEYTITGVWDGERFRFQWSLVPAYNWAEGSRYIEALLGAQRIRHQRWLWYEAEQFFRRRQLVWLDNMLKQMKVAGS